MKLTRNPTTEANPDLRGRKHHFIIENAPAAVLEAMDNMLTAAGWDNDTCPCYDDGFGCGWWIDLSEIDEFKAAYKEAKAGVKAFMAHQTNVNSSVVTIVIGDAFTVSKDTVIDAVNAFKTWRTNEAYEGRGGSAEWPRHSYAIVKGENLRISPNGRLWRTDGSEFTDFDGWQDHKYTTVAELNAQAEEPQEFEIIVKGSVGVTNPLNGDVIYVGAVENMSATVRKMPKVGDVIEAYYWLNKTTERVKVREILNDCPPRPAHLQAARDAWCNERYAGMFSDKAETQESLARCQELDDMTDDMIYIVFGVHVATEQSSEEEIERHCSEFKVDAAQMQLTFRLSCPVTQRRTIEGAHEIALQMNAQFDHEAIFFGRDRSWNLQSYDVQLAQIEEAHAEALEENDMFDGIIRDGLTPEQRAIQTRREGIDIYGERFKAMLEADHSEALEMDEEITFVREFESLNAEQAMAYAQQWAYSNADAATKQKMLERDHDEAFRIDAVRNCAIADNAKILAKPVEWRNRQFLWENTWSEEYLAFRLEAAHAEALLIAAGNQDVSAPLRIISDYMLRFMRNNKGAKLSEAKERLEKKIAQFTADGYDEQRLRQALATAISSHTREAFHSAIEL